MTEAMPSLLDRLGAIGHLPDDTEADKLKKRFLVYMGTFMSGGGILWGSIAAAHRLWLPAIVPLSYTGLTILNMAFFKATKKFEIVPNIRKARVTESVGEMTLELEGDEDVLTKAIRYLESRGVKVESAMGESVI